jgi:uncharacterized cofD-like protein
VSPAHGARPRIVAIGGGHGLATTLRGCQPWAGELTAIVSVADDGGSSGRLRESTPGMGAPGDLRRCLTSLAAPGRATLAAALEHRFEKGDLAGHPAGNALLTALYEQLGDLEAAVEAVADILGVGATVVPATAEPVDLVATTATGVVHGQVAIEAASEVAGVRVRPRDPKVPKSALEALAIADLVVIGPGSFYGSVLAAAVAPQLQQAIASSPGRRVLVHNLFAIDAVADRLAALERHGIAAGVIIVQTDTPRLEDVTGVEIVEADVARPTGLAHDPERLGEVLQGLSY